MFPRDFTFSTKYANLSDGIKTKFHCINSSQVTRDSFPTMQKHVQIVFLLIILSLSGCASVNGLSDSAQMGNIIPVEPAPADGRAQLAIARYNEILARVPLKNEERAELLFQRGMYYDRLGLPSLAQFDFEQAIKLKPDMAEAYNSIGIYHTQQMEFIQAYEAFDSSLDINPQLDYAFLNRGIALYYGGRPDLAVKDLGEFYKKDEADPYRALWRFIAESEVDPLKALESLRVIRPSLDPKNWATTIVDLYLNDISENALLDSLAVGVKSRKQLTDRLCEAYFYLGKYHNARGNKGIASNYFKLALSTNVYEYVEHRYARVELNLLRERIFKEVTNN